MKKNITINMQGRLYAIDEDAYDLLKQYEDSLRGYFSGKDGGNEIVDDIEARIAELFDETLAGGKTAVDIDDVQRIITRIGNPRQMDDSGDDNAVDGQSGSAAGDRDTQIPADGTSADSTAGSADSIWERIKKVFVRPDRRFFRDAADKKVFGVMSGLAHYYGGDVTWWRLAMVLMVVTCFFLPADLNKLSFYLCLIYCVFGLVMPVACTPEDRLRMNGRTVNPQHLAEEVAADSRATQQPQPRGCLSMAVDGLLALVKIALWLMVISFVAVLMIMLASLLLMLFVPTLPFFTKYGLLFSWSDHPFVGTVAVLCIVLLVVLGAFWLARLLFVGSGRRPLSWRQRLAVVLLLVAAFTGSMVCGTIIISDLVQQLERYDRAEQADWRQRHMHDGLFMTDADWNYLSQGGWQVLAAENCDHYTSCGEYYTGDRNRRYLDCFNENGRQLLRVEHTDSALSPGTYTLTAVARADGPGACIYAIADGKTYQVEIPAEGRTGGTLWQEAKGYVSDDIDDADIDDLEDDSASASTAGRSKSQAIADANFGDGFGWCRVTIPGIVSKSGRISYGLTSDSSQTGQVFQGMWFSATDFKIICNTK